MAVFSHVLTLRTPQRGFIDEAVDSVIGSSLYDACDVKIEFLHRAVVLQSVPELQKPLWTLTHIEGLEPEGWGLKKS